MNKNVRMSFKVTGIALAVSQAFAPLSQAQAQASESAQPPAPVAAQGEQQVVVTGIRASARSSLAIKRDTMEIVDSITAEDIGKLPDPNVAETLTRIPGVQGYRYGGEGASPVGAGSGITIRGLSGQTASQVNGRAAFTAGGREFNIEGAIPGMIAGVDVYKNPSAEHIEGAIGGLVNLRTRNPSDFKGPTGAFSVNSRYNDLAKKVDPELFGLLANKWDLGGGSRLGVMGAAVYQKSTGRSDSTPTGGGANLKRAIRADSAEYASLAAKNTANNLMEPLAAHVGKTDIHYMAPVAMRPTSATESFNMPDLSLLTPEQRANVMAAPGYAANAFQETIIRTRRGLNLAADYRVDNTLRFYTDYNYTYYQYHQQYRFLLPNGNLGNVRNLQTTPFNFTESYANRNFNGGSDDVLVDKRVLGGTSLNAPVSTIGGDEKSPSTTWTVAAGAEWSPTPDLSFKADFSYIKAHRTKDNRSVHMDSAPGLSWDVTRYAAGAPHTMSLSGPSLSDPKNFVFNRFDNGGNDASDDDGQALALSGSYHLGDGMFSKLKFGTRYARYESLYTNHGYGAPLNRPGAISAATLSDMLELPPNNVMDGKAGIAGGYLVYSPDRLSGDQVLNAFPNSGIPLDSARAENLLDRRIIGETTLAGYVTSDFSALDERIKGNVGVRVVRTEGTATAQNLDTRSTPNTIVETTSKKTYTNVLPSFNMTYDIVPDFLARFGYGRGMTRPGTDKLNPRTNVNLATGTGTTGNPDLKPQIADSYDLSFERYFSKTNYVSTALFTKQIKGFHNTISECQPVPTALGYTGIVSNSCPAGQYQISKDVNAEKGYARGVELAGQYFFDASHGVLNNFGVSGSYTYVKTSNPLNFGTAAVPRIVDTPQPMQSDHNYSVSGMYEDSKLSARLVYTWRSPMSFGNVAFVPLDGRFIDAYGILDASLNYEINDNVTLSVNASNILDKAPHRFLGAPNDYESGIERQHFANGRIFSIGLRFKFGK